ncbi:hypothetical protein AYI70_g9995 [Smittium culicis]|uniref:Uncharacterized protein n=1 Tax=Smittium culicis TaxID=133412 RepID=A0A1R1X8N2_9FUNG|nr:hypothetical protein AYI70_g9995 [Smittium culicis]
MKAFFELQYEARNCMCTNAHQTIRCADSHEDSDRMYSGFAFNRENTLEIWPTRRGTIRLEKKKKLDRYFFYQDSKAEEMSALKQEWRN